MLKSTKKRTILYISSDPRYEFFDSDEECNNYLIDKSDGMEDEHGSNNMFLIKL